MCARARLGSSATAWSKHSSAPSLAASTRSTPSTYASSAAADVVETGSPYRSSRIGLRGERRGDDLVAVVVHERLLAIEAERFEHRAVLDREQDGVVPR